MSSDAVDAPPRPASSAGEVAKAVDVLRGIAGDLGARMVVVGGPDAPTEELESVVRLLDDEFGTSIALGSTGTTIEGGADLLVADRDGGRQLAEVLGRIVTDVGDVRAGGEEDLARRVEAPRPVTARVSGARPLREELPERFAQLVEEYREALLSLLGERAYRIETDARQRVPRLASAMAELRADPRDAIALHAEVMKSLAGEQPEALLVAARDESTMLLVEVLGYLARAYRDAGGGGLVAAGA